ncbi:MAG: aldose 1-epimerase family protein [Erysipelotrichaceae bacterium]|nr:aldose 1-epimerase family protein [Erysipelotrichaceae bacterium]
MMIENDHYRFECSLKAAEIVSFKDKLNDIEYIWSGDSNYWGGRNPVLFPVIGSSYDKQYWFDNEAYTMGNHGFARNSVFEHVKSTEDSVTLCLRSDDITKKQYPFEFELYVTYKLVNDTIIITYRIFNRTNKQMPFAFGLHPAFNCPINNDGEFNDYWVEFASPCKLRGHNPMINKGLVSKIDLDHELFNKYKTLSFEDLASPYITLTNGKHGVRVSTVGYDKVAVWSPQAPFVCLEPWHPSPNKVDKDLPFEKRDASIVLGVDQSYLTSYTISVF